MVLFCPDVGERCATGRTGAFMLNRSVRAVDLGQQVSHKGGEVPIPCLDGTAGKASVPVGSLEEDPAGTRHGPGYFTLILPLITTWMLQK